MRNDLTFTADQIANSIEITCDVSAISLPIGER